MDREIMGPIKKVTNKNKLHKYTQMSSVRIAGRKFFLNTMHPMINMLECSYRHGTRHA